MQLVDWLDDLCVRFIINLPHEELESVERICFQVEEAQWFYEDFIRPLDPSLPSLNLKKFCLLIFQHCPLLSAFSEDHHTAAYSEFLAYKTRVPVRGAIMLNDAMDQVVLVKGWKKGARWSFPRGKINKGEDDLDCAVREVYEETGFELREAGLVKDESEMKYIEVSMREQHMRLYVFRGVPLDAHFEPRTRKEISAIKWYKLSELPTLKKQKHTQHQDGTGEDALKDNMFYMVAPFLGPLKNWIKQQLKIDRATARQATRTAPQVHTDVDEVTAEELTAQPDEADETIADEDIEEQHFEQLLANLRGPWAVSEATNFPEVAMSPQGAHDPAAELKRLLSVGGSSLSPPASATMHQPQAGSNSLLSMLQGRSAPGVDTRFAPESVFPPRTPLDQMSATPIEPRSPTHHHQPHPPVFSHIAPPPAFPIPSTGAFHGQLPNSIARPLPPDAYGNGPNGYYGPVVSGLGPRVPYPQHMARATPPVHGPGVPHNVPQAPRPYHRTGDPEFALAHQFPSIHGPTIPPASQLPPPKLNPHTMSLLNAFKSNSKPPATSTASKSPPKPSAEMLNTMRVRQQVYARGPPPMQQISGVISSSAQGSHTLGHLLEKQVPPPATQSSSAHQSALLNLFRSPPTPTTKPIQQERTASSMLGSELAELSALPSPNATVRGRRAGYPGSFTEADVEVQPPTISYLDAQKPRTPLPTKPSKLTSATVSGPLNNPDFNTVRGLPKPSELRNGDATVASDARQAQSSPTTNLPQFSILARPSDGPRLSPSRNTSPIPAGRTDSKVVGSPSKPFQPQILRRPDVQSGIAPLSGGTTEQQLQSPGALEKHLATAADKDTLLSLLTTTKPAPPQALPPPLLPQPPPSSDLSRMAKEPRLPPLSSRRGVNIEREDRAEAIQERFEYDRNTDAHLASQRQQKNALLSLFAAPRPGNETPPRQVISHQPMSHVVTPVSPLPERQASAETGRSRISSIASLIGESSVAPKVVKRDLVAVEPGSGTESPVVEAATQPTIGGSRRGSAVPTPVSHADRSFLLGYLEGVARGAGAGVKK
ncbi:mRNA-decapping enzyme subunit 2 [Coniosporium apollinis]|uniref:mRNA-decapping enzyme subunit 2 n=1 Tax=Coniosporium apollinis TaxID=61459 RepID=A0ABQ9NMR6_9PEZI|nr:mRNA-decapping enzyme subunit 2 [Coniosporium apollinis]